MQYLVYQHIKLTKKKKKKTDHDIYIYKIKRVQYFTKVLLINEEITVSYNNYFHTTHRN
jgi:hypothetical protein